jgi:formiminotetrahydrofolate cyclodeaminase
MGEMAQRAAVREETVGGFLLRLASRTSTPAGGAVAALSAAQAAGLLAMAARFTTNAHSPDAAIVTAEVVQTAGRLQERALDLATEDEEAFAAVSAAYEIPRDDTDGSRRQRAIRDALADAAQPPSEVLAVARELLPLAEQLLPLVNPTLVCDVAASVEAVRAAAAIAGMDVAANLRGLPPDDPRRRHLEEIADLDQFLERAAALGESVRRKVHS